MAILVRLPGSIGGVVLDMVGCDAVRLDVEERGCPLGLSGRRVLVCASDDVVGRAAGVWGVAECVRGGRTGDIGVTGR